MSTKYRDAPPHFPELAAEYEILCEIGRDGADVIYLGRERELSREVAIKVVRLPWTWKPRKRHPGYSAREARSIAALRHPNLVSLYDTQPLSHGRLALVMQHIRGRTLKSEIRQRGALPVAEAERILGDLGRALAYVRSFGVLHGDVKSENVFLDEETGSAFLGIARLSAEGELTRPGTVIGATTYLPPEQGDAAIPDSQDIYSLGLVAYEMLSGLTPWLVEGRFRRIYKPGHEDLPALASLRPDMPPRLQYVVERALRTDPAERWATADDLVAALADGSRASAPLADSSSKPPPVNPVVARAAPRTSDRVRPAWLGRRRNLVLAYLMILALIVTPTLVVRGRGDDRRTASANVAVSPAASPADAAPPGLSDPLPSAGKAAAGSVAALVFPIFGSEQVGVAGDTLATPLVVQVKDADGRTIPNAKVAFRVTAGRGRVEPATTLSNEHGLVKARWLPMEAGLHEVEAFVPGSEIVPVTFQARISARPAARETITTPPDRDDQAISTPPAEVPRLAVRPVIAVGGTHTCALQSAGEVWCWGGNESGQSGAGSTSRRLQHGRVAMPEPIAQLSAGVSHTCGVSVFGNAFCWGANDAGQLGDGTVVSRVEPVRVTGDHAFTDIYAGAVHTCAVDASDRLYCWGRNTHGQLGDGTRTNRPAPVRAGGDRPFTAVAVGWAHTCALSNGRAYCWGRNASGELGDGSTADRSSSATVAGAHSFTAIAAGSGHTCGLSRDGTILCWGQNVHGQLGTGDRGGKLVPVPVTAAEKFGQVTTGSVHTCGLTRRGEAFCWGRNSYGQLGDGMTEDQARPVAVEGGLRFGSLHARGAHTCGTAPGAGGTSYCWGFNLSGQLGDGTRSNRTRPVVAGTPR